MTRVPGFGILLVTVALGQTVPPAQRPAPPVQRKSQQPIAPAFYPIEALVVEGNQLYTQEQILAASGLRAGFPGGKMAFEGARDRLVATGYFDTVGYKFESAPGGNSYLGSFQVAEVQQVFPWRLEDLPVSPEEFTRVAKAYNPLFGPKIPGTDTVLNFYTRILQTIASSRANAEMKVVAKVTSDAPDKVFVVFRPNTPPVTIAEVRFSGAQLIPSQELGRIIAPVAIGAVWSEPRFREFLKNQISPVYEARGRIRVSYPKVTTEPSPTVKGLLVNVTVDEGPEYKLSDIEVNGTPLSPREIQDEAQIKTGETVNFSAISEGMERVMKKIRAQGFLKASYKSQRQIHDTEKTVEVAITVDPGPQYLFRKLEVQGLDIQSEPVVRKLWAMKPGQPFNAGYPDFFLQRVREDGVFDNLGKTKAVTREDDRALQVDVTLIFTGEPAPPANRRRPN